MSRFHWQLSIIVCLTAIPAIASADESEFREFLQDYARSILTGDSLAVRDAWWPADLAHSERFELLYSAPTPKIDGASILVSASSSARGQAAALDVTILPKTGDIARVQLSFRGGENGDSTIYYGIHDGDRWWLRHPIPIFVAGWPVDESRFLRVHRHPDLEANPIALAAMDSFVVETAEHLGLGPQVLQRIGTQRIDWVLAPEDVVTGLVGSATEGVANLQMDAVVSQHHYHPHELAHLLVNLALGEAPIATLPAYQEGFAVWAGGRFNSSAAMQLELGALFLENDFVELREFLPWAAFRQLPGDMSYAPSAVLVELLHDQLGVTEFLRYYRSHSGSFERVSSWTAPHLLSSLARALRCDMVALNDILERYLASRAPGNFRSGVDVPTDNQLRREQDGLSAEWSIQGKDIHLVLSARDSVELRGAFLWPPAATSFPKSNLFEEHFPGRAHAGERHALVFAAGEIGLYDYALDILLAKRADGFAPDPLFWDASRKEMRLRVAVEQLPGILEAAEFWSAAPRHGVLSERPEP